MANVETQFQGSIIDGQQVAAFVTSYLSIPDSVGLASLIAGHQVWAQAVNGVIDGAFADLHIQMAVPMPSGMNAPTGATFLASRASQTGIFSFSATGTDRRWGFAIPSLSSSVLSAGKIDLANTDVVALIDLLLNPTDLFTNPQLQVLEVLLDALLSFRKFSELRIRSLRAQ